MNQAVTLARTETAKLQHQHFLESLQLITDRDRIVLEATEFFHKLVAEAKHKISAIENDKTRLEEQISQLTLVNHNLDCQLVSFNSQIKTLETEKTQLSEKHDLALQDILKANLTLKEGLSQTTTDNNDLKALLSNRNQQVKALEHCNSQLRETTEDLKKQHSHNFETLKKDFDLLTVTHNNQLDQLKLK